jgi:hypothetical protein
MTVTDASVTDRREKAASDFRVKSTVWVKWRCLGSGNRSTDVGRRESQFGMKCGPRTGRRWIVKAGR